MESLFTSWGFHITKLTDKDSLLIIDKLKNYRSLDPNDIFVFYFSGHGYHIPDKNGDEDDGQDEAIVLSNSKENILFVDDALFGYLNDIKAKKLIILDSCHSGTAFKGFDNKVQPKTLPEGSSYRVFQTKSFRPRESSLNNGKYIVLSASQDNEVSLATPNGSLFTNALVSELKSGGDDKGLLELKYEIENSIRRYSSGVGQKMQHPNFVVSNSNIQNISLNQFLNDNNREKPKVSITRNKHCKDGQLLSFQIDTHGTKGYLTIFSIENGKPLIMTQTSQPVSGTLNFQDDFYRKASNRMLQKLWKRLFGRKK